MLTLWPISSHWLTLWAISYKLTVSSSIALADCAGKIKGADYLGSTSQADSVDNITQSNCFLKNEVPGQGTVAKTLMHLTQEHLTFHVWIKYPSFNAWIRYFVWNFKGCLWNSTQNILPIYWKIWFQYRVEILRPLGFKSSWMFFKCPSEISKDLI